MKGPFIETKIGISRFFFSILAALIISFVLSLELSRKAFISSRLSRKAFIYSRLSRKAFISIPFFNPLPLPLINFGYGEYSNPQPIASASI